MHVVDQWSDARGWCPLPAPARNVLRATICAASLWSSACGSETNEPGNTSLDLSVESYDFGAIALGGRSTTLAVTVTNDGADITGALAVAIAGPASGDFARPRDECSGRQIAAGATCAIDIELVPTAVGPREAQLRVSDPRGEAVVAGLRGSGSGSGLSVLPIATNFGETRIGHAGVTKTFAVRNTSVLAAGPLTVTVTGVHAAEFVVTRDTCSGASLPTASTCAIDVQFAPAAAGARQARLDVGSGTALIRSATLTGTAGSAALLDIAPAAHQFGDHVIGSHSPIETFVVTNVGTTPTGALSVGVIGANAADFQLHSVGCWGPSLAPGASCSFEARFVPLAVGSRSASIQIADGFGTDASVALSGQGHPVPAPPVQLTLDPTSVAFGVTPVDGSVTQLVTVTNPGTNPTGPLVAEARLCVPYYYYYYYDCTPSPIFTLTLDSCNGTDLAPGASCSVSITFKPTYTGSVTGYLNVVASNSYGSLHLSGTGAGLHAIVPGLNFPPVPAGLVSASQNLVVSNAAATPTGPITTALSGTGFEITSNGCQGVSLEPGASCSVGVRFAPPTPGPFSGSVNFTALPGGTVIASLNGNGT